MNPYDTAMQIEKEGEALYADFAKRSPSKGLAIIFMRLAEDELRHYEVFEKMKKNRQPVIVKSALPDDAETVFSELKKETFDFSLSQPDLYRKALEAEKKSIQFYTQYAKAARSEEERDVFLSIIREERQHAAIVENIIEFLTAPETWSENAEFIRSGEEYIL